MSTDIDNMTPFHYAALAANKEMVQLFFDAKIPIDTLVKRRTWLSEYQQGKLTYIMQDVSPHPSADLDLTRGLIVLHYAALAGHADNCKLFLGHGTNPNAKSEYGGTPLHLALKKTLHGLEWPFYTDQWNDPASKIEYATTVRESCDLPV
jgi:ankyrin repeat protein